MNDLLGVFHCDDSDKDSVYSTDSNLMLFAFYAE